MENVTKGIRVTQFIKKHKILGIVIILLILLVVFRIGAAIYNQMTPAEDTHKAVTVQTTVADYTDISSTAPLTGRVEPKDEVPVVPLAAGQVTAVYVKVGDYVNAGSVLFEIDKSQVAASYNQAKAAYDLASSTYNNMITLYNAGAISKSAFDQAYVSYVSAKESFNAAAEMYSNYSVTAPISGYVTSITVSEGSVAGQSVAASISNIEQLIIKTTISEYLSSRVHKDEEVNIKISSLSDQIYKGVITELSPAPAYGTLTYPATIAVQDKSGDIKAGMFAEVIVKDQESKNALCVPSDAIISKNGDNVVVVLNKDNIPSYVKVEIGIDNGTMAEILSGVKKGDVIVTAGQQYITEGEAVQLSSAGSDSTNTSGNNKK